MYIFDTICQLYLYVQIDTDFTMYQLSKQTNYLWRIIAYICEIINEDDRINVKNTIMYPVKNYWTNVESITKFRGNIKMNEYIDFSSMKDLY